MEITDLEYNLIGPVAALGSMHSPIISWSGLKCLLWLDDCRYFRGLLFYLLLCTQHRKGPARSKLAHRNGATNARGHKIGPLFSNSSPVPSSPLPTSLLVNSPCFRQVQNVDRLRITPLTKIHHLSVSFRDLSRTAHTATSPPHEANEQLSGICTPVLTSRQDPCEEFL